ncbi:hypothetical protein BGZ83_006390 [Gryganskiella cystojenkinii]|nr:hypothetical protein BGZ83_006390 [Gryganskiella cystojenkinii]
MASVVTSTSTRPEARDTVSSIQPQDPVVIKQETGNSSSHHLATSSAPPLREDSDMEGVIHDPEEGHDADGENDDDEQEQAHDDEQEEEDPEREVGDDDDEEDEDEDEDEVDITGQSSQGPPRLTEGDDDVDLTLSSDEDDEEDQHAIDDSNLPEETVCRWKDCGKVLPTLAALVIHLSDEHIGWKKPSYTCEWQGCSRRPIAQTTRFALISHMRSHTKHKPYDCPVPECDKSFSRSDAMAKHLKCQHGDVPERFTGRKSRGRYTMKDPSASSTLLRSTGSYGGKKRRIDSGSGADIGSSWSKHDSKPAKLRKLGSNGRQDLDRSVLERISHHSGRDRHHFLPASAFSSRKHGSTGAVSGDGNGDQDDDDMLGYEDEILRRAFQDYNINHNKQDDEDDDAEDSDFAIDNGQTPKQRYGMLKAKFEYIHNERDSLESEYEDLKRKLGRLRTERELLLDALLESQEEFQDPALMAVEDSE